MFNRRLLSGLIVLAVTLALPFEGLPATPDSTGAGSTDQQFQAYTTFYYARRNLDFAIEMTLRESFLAWLGEGINQEAATRSVTDPVGTLAAISPPELTGFDESSFEYPDGLDDAPLSVRFATLENCQRTEFYYKYLQARLIKDRLIRSATADQRQRMFKSDLESTFTLYRDGQYRNAILRYDELMDRYGYADVADIAFYRAECYLALQLYNQAEADYQFVVDHSTDPWYRTQALARLINVSGDRGASQSIEKYWEQYDAEKQIRDDDYWETAEVAGRYLLAIGEWRAARNILDTVPTDSPYYWSSAVRAADCQTALKDFDDATTRYYGILDETIAKKTVPYDLAIDIELKLGYIDYLKGDFDGALTKLSSIDAEGDAGERAKIGSIWALYRLSAYAQVTTLAQKFIDVHPQSQYQYEARCLIGFANEMLGQADGALDNYKIVMSALDDRQDFHDFNYELQAISENLGRLGQLEEAIFVNGESDLFPDYLSMRKQLTSLMDGVRFTRALKSSPLLRDILNEQKELASVIAQQADLEHQVLDSKDARLIDKYREAIGQLKAINSKLGAGVEYYLNQKSLIQREEDKLYESQVGDSMRAELEREWVGTREAMSMVRQYLDAPDSGDPATLVDFAGVEIRLAGIQDNILDVEADLQNYGQDVVSSNLDEWSDFAYQRYTYGGLNFDYLYTRESRLGELDGFIQQINQLLQQRARDRADTLKLAVELIPSGKAGDAPYYAPQMPLWGLTPVAAAVEAVPVADTAKAVAAPLEEVPAVPDATPALESQKVPESLPTDQVPPAGQETAPPDTTGKTSPPPQNGGNGGENPQNGPSVP